MHPNIAIPAAFAKQFKTRLDWDLATEPEPACDGRSLYVPRGKGLGGSSAMNAMLYVRGRPLDYDLWDVPGWGWSDLRPYFLRAEDNARGASEHHGAGGPLRVEDERSPRPLTGRFLQAAEATGIPRIADYNGPEQDGAAVCQVTQRRGRRWSANDAYLRPARSRPNLEVVTGGSLADAESPRRLLEWLVRRTGPLTSSVAEAFAFVRSRPGLPAADLQFHFAPAYFVDHGFADFDGHAMTFGPVLIAPRSRGSVTLRSADPAAKPRLLTNALSEPEDLAALAAGLRLAREIAAAAPLAEVVVRELFPGAGVTTDDDLAADVRRRVELLYHPVGTCRMGSGEDAVVDAELRVRGVEGLRVVDASVFPLIPGGNTNAPTIAVAERAADVIRGR